MSPSAIVAGSVAQRPGRGGHTWVFLQYLLGLRDLGWDVTLLDRLEPDMSVDAGGRPAPPEQSENVRYLQQVLSRFGLDGDYALMLDGGERSLGLERAELLERVEASSMLLNVNGFVTDPEVLARAPLRVFLDIDPGFGQMWRELGLHDLFAGHDRFVTVGESIGSPGCAIPTCGLDWITTPQPIVLDHWPDRAGSGGAFTSVGSWRGPFAPVEFEGATYGLRVHECRRFAELPRLVEGETFEFALDIDEADAGDVELLRSNEWELVDPHSAASDPWAYRDYVQDSKAELMIAKNMYVRARSGWFSDRSICYLASGRPVLAQETGFSDHHPAGEGLLAFSTLEEAAAGATEIARDHERHSRAARALAEERFGSATVLGRLLERLGIA
jgi:hypothetical protein